MPNFSVACLLKIDLNNSLKEFIGSQMIRADKLTKKTYPLKRLNDVNILLNDR